MTDWAPRIAHFLTAPYWLEEWAAKMQTARSVKMAKPYRQAPLIGADETTGLPVLRERQQRMADLLGQLVPQFDDEFILHVATEVGLDEVVTFNTEREGALDFDFTALQMV